jgi:hypothetical protein
MSVSKLVLNTIKTQHAHVVDLEHQDVTYWAKSVAFYYAMLIAADEDPLDDPEDQAEIIEFFKKVLNNSSEHYMESVNKYM